MRELIGEHNIITYQEKPGNYNISGIGSTILLIITYQEKSGNYNSEFIITLDPPIITYQEKSGNYNAILVALFGNLIITYQEKSVFSDICILTRRGLIFNTTPVISALY